MQGFYNALRVQRWDDHRYYHHSRINQSLHFVSALSFLCAYGLVFVNPVAAALIGWLVAMISRQIGHFIFEPKGYDAVNHATHEYKERVKLGYNLKRKVVLLSIWGLSPVLLYVEPSLFGLFPDDSTSADFLNHLASLWIFLGAAALVFRMVHLFILEDVQTGVVWFTKILTDPFHDLVLYHKAPFYLLRGQLMDPMTPEEVEPEHLDLHA